MAKIHGLVYILIGAFISIMSWRLDQEKLLFFFYAGWVFIGIGVVKLIFNWIKNKANKPKVHIKQTVPNVVQHNTSQHKPSPIMPQHPAIPQQVKYCHNCGTALRLHHKFCAKCGARV